MEKVYAPEFPVRVIGKRGPKEYNFCPLKIYQVNRFNKRIVASQKFFKVEALRLPTIGRLLLM